MLTAHADGAVRNLQSITGCISNIILRTAIQFYAMFIFVSTRLLISVDHAGIKMWKT